MLTGRSAIEAKEEGLDSGSDDYLSKPFHPRELLARVRALTRRSVAVSPTLLKVGDLELDSKEMKAIRAGKSIDLSPKEFQLLEFFLRHPSTVFSADAIIERVWTSDSDTTSLSVRVYINKLRQKIDRDGEKSIIENVKGHGYKLNL
jgi:DNA-binding response OmpR family regulator